MKAFRQKQTVPTQCRRGPPGTSSALRGRREKRERRYAGMTADPELRYGYHPVGPDSTVRTRASLCAWRPREEQPCAALQEASGHHTIRCSGECRRESSPSGACGRRRLRRSSTAAARRPGGGVSKQRQASAATEKTRQPRQWRVDGDGASPGSSGSETVAPTEAIDSGRDDNSVLPE